MRKDSSVSKIIFSSRFPFDIRRSPTYEIVYFFSAWSSWFTTVGIAGLGGMFFGLSLQISGQFDILRLKVEGLFDEENVETSSSKKTSIDGMFTKDQNIQLNKKLKMTINLHNETIDLGELLSRSFGPIIFLHLIAASILIGTSSLMLVLAPNVEKSIYVNFLFGTFADTFIHTYVGTRLMTSNTRIYESVYNLDWHKCDLINQKMILMMIMRAQHATAIRIPFFKASLETFLKVRSSAVFTLNSLEEKI